MRYVVNQWPSCRPPVSAISWRNSPFACFATRHNIGASCRYANWLAVCRTYL